jgi:hypothetical protein
MFGDHGKIRLARARIDSFPQYLADQFGATDFDAGITGPFQRVGQVFQAYSVENARSGKLPGTIAFMP